MRDRISLHFPFTHSYSFMPPGKIHSVVTVNGSIMHGHYSFSPEMLWKSFSAAALYHADRDVTNDYQHHDFVDMFTRALRAWIKEFIDEAANGRRDNLNPRLSRPDLKTGTGLQNFLGLVWLVVFAKTLYPDCVDSMLEKHHSLRDNVLKALDIFVSHWRAGNLAHKLSHKGTELAFDESLVSAAKMIALARVPRGNDGARFAEMERLFSEARKVCPSLHPAPQVKPLQAPRITRLSLGKYTPSLRVC